MLSFKPIIVLLLCLAVPAWQQMNAQCPITVSAGPDKYVCNPGGSVALDGSISGSYIGFRWSPASGLSSTTDLNPTATVNGTTTYTLTAAAEDPSAPNLVNNPGFESGNSGFTSTYSYNPLPITPGTYTITTSPALVLSTFPPCDDHTYGNGTGNMMLINGNGSSSSSVWCQTIPVMANSWYIMSAWIIASPISPPEMQFTVNGTNAGDPFPAPTGLCDWQQFSATWFSGSATSANLCILDVSGSGNGFFGDDYALDDIAFMKACTVSDMVTVSIATVNAVLPPSVVLPCSAAVDGIALNGSGSSSGPGYSYQWSGPGILSGENTPIAIVNEPGYYTLTVSFDTGDDICTDEAIIQVLPDPNTVVASASSGDDLTCINLNVELDGAGSSTGPTISYDWQPSSGVVSGNGTLNPIVNQPGFYTLVVTNTVSGCTAEAFAYVNQYNTPAVAAGLAPGPLSCIDTTLTLSGNGSSTGGEYSYLWTGPGIVSGSATLNNCVVDAPGLYTLLVSNDISGCTATVNVAVTSNTTPPTALAAADPPGTLDCLNPSLGLNSAGSSSGAGFTYLWTTANGHFTGPVDSTSTQVDTTGLYVLTITNTQNGCTASDTVAVSTDGAQPVVEVASPLPVLNCAADSVQIDAGQSTSGPDLVYTWSTTGGSILSGDTTLAPWIGSAGDYILSIVNTANGCTATDTVTIIQDIAAPVAAILPPAGLNCLTTQISLDGSNSSAGPDFGISWSFAPQGGGSGPGFVSGDSTLTPVVNAPGTYTLVVTNLTNFCTDIDSVVVSQDISAPVAEAGQAPILDCIVQSDTLDAGGSSQGPNFSYLWNTGDTVLQVVVSTPGTYGLTVTNNSNGCTAADSVVVLLFGDLPSVAIDTPGILTCAQPEILLSASASGGPAFSYLWSYTGPGAGILSGDTTLTPVAGSAGVYTLLVTNTQTGCSASGQITLQESTTLPIADAGQPQILLCGTLNTFLDGSLSSTGPNFSYAWTTTGGNLLNGVNTLSPEINAPGTYTLLVTDTLNGCTATASVDVGQDANAPVADAGPAQSITCLNSQVTLDGSNSSAGPSIQYLWSTTDGVIVSGATTPTPLVSAPGTYLLLVTNNSNNCQTLASVQVFDATQPPLAMAAAPQELNCAVGQVVLDGTGSSTGPGISYQWSGPGIVSGNGTLSPTVNAAGTYTLTVTDQANGCMATVTVTAIANTTPPLAAAAAPQLLGCTAAQVALDGTGSSTGPGISYQWSGPGIVSGATTLTPVVNAPGLYTLTVTDQVNGCTATATAMAASDGGSVTVLIAAPDTLSCTADQIVLDGSGSPSGVSFTYQWFTSNGNIVSGPNTPMPVVDAPGVYVLTLTDTANGCTGTAQIEVQENIAVPDVNAGPGFNLGCNLTSAMLSGSSATPGATFIWSTTGGNIVSGQNSANPVVDAPGTYTLVATHPESGCMASDTVVVGGVPMIFPELTVNVPNCNDPTGDIQFGGGMPPYLYSIDDGLSFQSDSLFDNLLPGLYILVVQDVAGCERTFVVDLPGVDAVSVVLPTTIVLEPGQSIQLVPALNFPVADVATVFWTPATGLDCTDCLTPLATPTEDIEYLVQVINQDGCSGTASVSIRFEQEEAGVYVPNVFSPNLDGLNDLFQVSTALPVSRFELHVYDRWGGLVYSGNDIDQGWDGTFRGKPMDPGVYGYWMLLEYPGGDKRLIEGGVLLVR